MHGSNVCRWHGGAAPQTRRAAARRAVEMEAHEHARRLVDARAGTDASEAEILLDYLWTLNAQWRIWNQMVADLDNAGEIAVSKDPEMMGRQRGYAFKVWHPPEVIGEGENTIVVRRGWVETKVDPLMVEGKDMAHLHPFVSQANAIGKELHAVLKTCATLQIADRQVRNAERYADALFELMDTFAEALGVNREQRQIGNQAVLMKMRKLQMVG